MYEPLFVPEIKKSPISLEGVKFGITYSDEYRTPDDPLADPLHIHDSTEIVFHLSGEVSFLINGKLYHVERGNAVISRANEVHVCIYDKPGKSEHYCLWISAGENSQLLRFLNDEGRSSVLSFDSPTVERLIKLFDFLYTNRDNEESNLSQTVALLRIIDIMTERSDDAKGELEIPSELRKIMTDIDKNFSNISSVGELLSNYFISYATLNRWFKKHLQISPRDYIESKKLAYAVGLLSVGKSVSDACAEAGFSDCSHFIVLFKKKFGKTPLQFKRSLEELR